MKSAYISLIIGPRGLEVYTGKPTHTKSWARNLVMLDLTFGPSFKVTVLREQKKLLKYEWEAY